MLATTTTPDLPFGAQLDWHLQRGTRADGTPRTKGVPWTNKDFARVVGAKSTEGEKHERTIRNWRNGETTPSPADFHAILMVLFGANPDYAGWKAGLTDKYHAARSQNADGTMTVASAPRAAAFPAKPLRCLGRDEDLKAVIECLTAGRDQTAVLVLGGPGMGKTTLTRQAANEAAVVARFGHRRWFVELETAPDAQALEAAILAAVGLDPATTKFDAALVHLGQAPGILLLDNLELAWDGERGKVEVLLARLHQMPALTLLASVRGNEPPGGLRWTRQRTMHPLEWPHDRDLFLDIAQDIKPDDPQLAPLLQDLGGVPLAIELVAMQAAAHGSLAAIHAEWQRTGVRLAQRRGAEPSRLTSLEKSLELSFDSARLGDAGRRLFSILGQLPAGIGAEDLDALLGECSFDARQGLLSSGLGFERGGRLDLLPPVREHARRLHSPTDEDTRLWRDHFISLANDYGELIGATGGADGVRRLTLELPNLVSAQRAAIESGKTDQATHAGDAISRLVRFIRLGETSSLSETVFSKGVNGDQIAQAKTLQSSGDVALSNYDYEQASQAYEQALPLYRKVGDIVGVANCIRGLGDIALRRSEHEAARAAYEQALPLYRKVGSILGEANCIHRLGEIALERSDHEAARAAYEQALPLYRKVGSIVGEANCIASFGDIALARFDHQAARAAYEQALPLYRKIGSILGETNCIQSLGDIAFRRSDHEAARTAYEQALQLYRKVGDLLGETNCIASLGDIALARSDHEAARKAYEQALPLFRKIDDLLGEANSIQSLGDIALCRSEHEAARAAYEQALPLYRKIGDIVGEASCIRGLGDIALARSDHETARTAYEQALSLFRKVGDILGEANCIRSLGDIALDDADAAAAPTNYLEALKLYERIPEPFSIGQTHWKLASITEGKTRAQHITAARSAWKSIDRPDLVALLEE